MDKQSKRKKLLLRVTVFIMLVTLITGIFGTLCFAAPEVSRTCPACNNKYQCDPFDESAKCPKCNRTLLEATEYFAQNKKVCPACKTEYAGDICWDCDRTYQEATEYEANRDTNTDSSKDEDDEEKGFWESVKSTLSDIEDTLSHVSEFFVMFFDGRLGEYIVGLLATDIFNTFVDLCEMLNNSSSGMLTLRQSFAIQVLLEIAERFAWLLWIVAALFGICEIAIHYKAGESVLEYAKQGGLNLFKSLLAMQLMLKVPIPLYTAFIKLTEKFINAVTPSSYQNGLTLSTVTSFFNGCSSYLTLVFAIVFLIVGIMVFLAHIKRSGTIIVLMLISPLHMWSIPRGYWDSFWGWCRQVIAVCITAFVQLALFYSSLDIMTTSGVVTGGASGGKFIAASALLLVALEVPRIADRFGFDTSVKGVGHTVGSTVRTVAMILK